MAGYLIRRILAGAVVLFAAVSLTFLMIRLIPGGPFASERSMPAHIEEQLLRPYKLDGREGRDWAEAQAKAWNWSETWVQRAGNTGSLTQQYVEYLADLLQGDLRRSTQYRNRTVAELLAVSLPVTMILGVTSLMIACAVGVSAGVWSAVRGQGPAGQSVVIMSVFAISIPTFVIGPLLIWIFALQFRMFPLGGWGTLWHLVLPAITLAIPYAAYIARLTRTSMRETLGQDFIRTARAKGREEFGVVMQHALRTAILPVVTYVGPLTAHLLTGSVVIETVFNIPGAGRFFVHAIENQDGFVLGGVVIVYCALLVLMNLVADIVSSILDRRIRLEDLK